MSSTISQRIKSLLALNNKKAAELARFMGLSPQSLHNKIARGSFNANDLIKIAEFTGSKLMFENAAGNIVLDSDCIRSEEKAEKKASKENSDDEEKPDLTKWLEQYT